MMTMKYCFSSVLRSSVRRACGLNYVRNKVSKSDETCDDGKKVSKMALTEGKRRQMIEMEMRMEKEMGNYFIPESISDKHWRELLLLKSPNERRKFYRYLKKREDDVRKQKRRHGKKVLERRVERERAFNVNPNHIQYGLGKNCLFFELRKSSLMKPYYNNLRDAVLFGQKIVIDLGYEDMMDYQEMQNCVNQIKMAHGSNKKDKDPFYLHICNANMDGRMVKKLKLTLPFLQKPHPLVNLTEESYLDLFPKEKLVYLSSHCDEVLHDYKHDDIYIIGGFVDKNKQGPVSVAKAKKDNLRMARFPLEKYLRWGSGNQCLSVNQVMDILLTMKNTMDWAIAFQHAPKRKTNRYIPKKKDDSDIRMKTDIKKTA